MDVLSPSGWLPDEVRPTSTQLGQTNGEMVEPLTALSLYIRQLLISGQHTVFANAALSATQSHTDAA